MQHSIKEIAKRYSEYSNLRKDEKRFSESGFIQFAKDNKDKYSLVTYKDDDFIVGTWEADTLIRDYKKTL